MHGFIIYLLNSHYHIRVWFTILLGFFAVISLISFIKLGYQFVKGRREDKGMEVYSRILYLVLFLLLFIIFEVLLYIIGEVYPKGVIPEGLYPFSFHPFLPVPNFSSLEVMIYSTIIGFVIYGLLQISYRVFLYLRRGKKRK